MSRSRAEASAMRPSLVGVRARLRRPILKLEPRHRLHTLAAPPFRTHVVAQPFWRASTPVVKRGSRSSRSPRDPCRQPIDDLLVSGKMNGRESRPSKIEIVSDEIGMVAGQVPLKFPVFRGFCRYHAVVPLAGFVHNVIVCRSKRRGRGLAPAAPGGAVGMNADVRM